MKAGRVLVVFMMALSGCQSERLARLEKENKELKVKLEAAAKSANLDGQERCAKQAARQFRAQGYDEQQFVGYTNHFHVLLNKCFMEIQDSSGSRESGRYVPTIYRTVFDAFEGKTYAEYFWRNAEGKKYWEVAPNLCKVIGVNGEETFCGSTEEFDQLIKRYMEE